MLDKNKKKIKLIGAEDLDLLFIKRNGRTKENCTVAYMLHNLS